MYNIFAVHKYNSLGTRVQHYIGTCFVSGWTDISGNKHLGHTCKTVTQTTMMNCFRKETAGKHLCMKYHTCFVFSNFLSAF